MNKQEADTLIAAIRSLLEPIANAAPPAKKCDHKFVGSNKCAKCGLNGGEIAALDTLARTKREATGNMGELSKPFDDAEEERRYQAWKNRIIEDAVIDPVLLHLLTIRPELVVEVERRVENLDGSTMKGRICSLIAQGWMNTTRATSAIRWELARTGADPGGGGTLNDRLNDLLRAGFLTKDAKGWQKAPNVKITEKALEK